LDGSADLDANATLSAGKLDGQLALDLAGLQSRARAAASAKPIDAQLQAKVHRADSKLTADLNLTGEAGQAAADLTYQQSDKLVNITADEIVSAVLTGQSVTLPEFTVPAQASIDLTKLGRAVPELPKVREGVELTGGKLEVVKLSIQGGAKPAANAAIELKEVAARRGDKPVRIEPIAFNLDSTLEGGRGSRCDSSNWRQASPRSMPADWPVTCARLSRPISASCSVS
jgi:hypothetical protein